jgi:hypothetical protein
LKRYFELRWKLPGPTALPIIGNCLQFPTNNLRKRFQELIQIALSCLPISALWTGLVLAVVLTDLDSIERVVEQEKLLERGNVVEKSGEPIL